MSPPSPLVFRGVELELELQACDFCGSTDFHPFWSKMRHGLNLPSVFCKVCGLCQTRPRPTPTALESFHAHLYNQFHKREVPIDPLGEYVTRTRGHAEKRLAVLERFAPPTEPLHVLEIGAGVGQFLDVAQRRTRWKMRGVEPGKPQAEFCKSLGLDVENAFFDEAQLEPESLDVIVSFHVLEHVRSPAAFLAKVNKLLKPNGTLYLEVPNLARPGVSLDHFFQFPHVFNFSAVTLRNYLVASGFVPRFSSERFQNLILLSKKTRATTSESRPAESGFEAYEVENFMQRLRMLQRVFVLAGTIPNLPVLEKVRSTLFAI
jgi:SAM-dependent methyltransferase